MSVLSTLRFIANHPLNRKNRIGAFTRYLKWQIGSRLLSGAFVHDWVGGAKFLVRTGETGLTGNIYAGLHEFPDMAFVLHFLREDDFFADIGANVGSYTLLACAAARARGIAFEPVPGTYRRLQENVRLNNLEARVECVNGAVGAKPERIFFTSGRDTMNHAVAENEVCSDTVEIGVVPLDSVLAGRVPLLMKIDVEGFETPVVAGAAQTLADPRLEAVIMELNGSGERYGFDEQQLLGAMKKFGFAPYDYEPFRRRLVSLDGKSRAGGNTLFIRDLEHVTERLTHARKFMVFDQEV